MREAWYQPDGKTVLTIGTDRMARVWDARKGTLVYSFGTTGGTESIVIDPGGRLDGTEAALKKNKSRMRYGTNRCRICAC